MKSVSAIVDSIRWFSNAALLRPTVVRTISANQDQPPATQVLGTAAALVALCEGVGIDPHHVVSQINRAKSNVDSPFNSTWRGMVEYAKGELLND